MEAHVLVGWNVRRVRVSKGLSQERLAFDANVDRSYLGGLERGEHNPSVDMLARIAKVLDVPLRDLFVEYDPEIGEIDGLPPGRKPSEP